MSELLHIQNFGPIKDVKLHLKKFNILIGDQGTGKSTVGKVYSLIKNFISVIFLNAEDDEKENNNTWQFEKYLDTFELKSYLKNDTEIHYSDPLNEIEIRYLNGKIVTNLNRTFSIPPNFNYIVAERVFVSTLSDAFFGLNQFGTKLPTLFNRFGNKYATARKENIKRDYNEILNVSFSNIDGVDSIILNDNLTIPLSNGSTGLQGTIPLLVVFDNIVEHINLKKGSGANRDHLLVIEEPELNLFPQTQRKLINHIIANNFQFNRDTSGKIITKDYKNKLIITTHSPYILTALNNLMYAHNIGQSHKEKVNKIINEEYWVNPNDVSVYMLLPNGNCEDIFDRKEDLIRAEKIDSVSELLNEQFDTLLNIELP